MRNWLKEKIIQNQLQKKDPDAFSEIYDLYVSKIYRFIYFKVSSVEEAEDLTSEVFLKTWQYINEGKGEIKHIGALLYRIARNIVIDYYRERAQKEKMNDELTDDLEIASDEFDKMQISLEMENIEKNLRELKDEYREVIILRFIEELSISEIAQILEKSKGAVRVLIFRSLETLKEILNEKNGK
jgi:RNA polymerase sigma-70 factor (ECF subfamily)